MKTALNLSFFEVAAGSKLSDRTGQKERISAFSKWSFIVNISWTVSRLFSCFWVVLSDANFEIRSLCQRNSAFHRAVTNQLGLFSLPLLFLIRGELARSALAGLDAKQTLILTLYFRSCSSKELPGRFPSASLTNRRTSAVIRTQAKAASLASDGRRCCWHWRSPGVCSWTIEPWPNDTPNSSQLEPSQSQCRWSWVSFVHPLGLSWLELACIWPSSNCRPTRVKFPPFGQLSLSCFVSVMWLCGIQTIEWFLASWLDLAASIGHPPMQVLIL